MDFYFRTDRGATRHCRYSVVLCKSSRYAKNPLWLLAAHLHRSLMQAPKTCTRESVLHNALNPCLRGGDTARGGWAVRLRSADGDAPGWSGQIRTRSDVGRIANRSGGSRSTASPSPPACTGSGALTSIRGALQAWPRLRGLPPGASTT